MRRLLLTFFALSTALMLSGYGCSNDKESQAPAKAALLTCETVASTLDALYPFRRDGKLNMTTVDLIDKARGITDPFCLGPAPDVDSTVKDLAVDRGASILIGILASVK